MSILMSHMMVTKDPQYVHKKCFWTILVTFIFDIKIDINMCEPHYVNFFFFFWTSSIVCVFDFLTFDIILTSFWHFDIFFNLNHLSLSQGYFFLLFVCVCGNVPLSFEICSVFCIIYKLLALIGHYLGMTAGNSLMRICYVKWKEGERN